MHLKNDVYLSQCFPSMGHFLFIVLKESVFEDYSYIILSLAELSMCVLVTLVD